MKLSIFPKFGALNSKPVFESFKKGAESLGCSVVEHDLDADIYVIWSVLWNGRMKPNEEIWKIAKDQGKDVIVLEVGGLKRGITWKVGINGINNFGFFSHTTDLIPNRSKIIDISLKPWTNSGNHILICGQHRLSEQWKHRISQEDWATNVIKSIKKHSTKQIIVRPHPRDYAWVEKIKNLGVKIKIPKKISHTYDDFDFEDDLLNSWAVVSPTSNTGSQAIISGIPAFVEKDSLAWPVGNHTFDKINDPFRPNREQWLEELCHTEWTLEEIESGLPISRILSKKVDK